MICQHCGHRTEGRDRYEAGGVTLCTLSRSLTYKSAAIYPTWAEYEVVRALMARPGVVLTRDVLIEQMHGPGHHCTDRVVDTLIKRLRRKMRAAWGRSDWIRTRTGHGYQWDPMPSPKA